MPRTAHGLSPKQQRFVEEYLIDLNATQAAIRAGYSPKTANHNVGRLMVNDGIRDAIALRQVALADANAVTPARVIEELAHVGFANMTTYMRWGPDGVRLTDSDTLTPAQCRVVAEVSETTTKDGGTIRLKLHNKLTALEKLGERLGLWKTAQGEITVNQYVLTWLSKPSP